MNDIILNIYYCKCVYLFTSSIQFVNKQVVAVDFHLANNMASVWSVLGEELLALDVFVTISSNC
jgi:hypothetical protein